MAFLYAKSHKCKKLSALYSLAVFLDCDLGLETFYKFNKLSCRTCMDSFVICYYILEFLHFFILQVFIFNFKNLSNFFLQYTEKYG